MVAQQLTWNGTLKLWTWNLPAGLTCPGQTHWCVRHCYARGRRFGQPRVRRSLKTRLAFSRHPDFVPLLISDCKDFQVVRVHSSGDFYSVNYLLKWLHIAQKCPRTTFFTYTRTWSLPAYLEALERLSGQPNFYLWLSKDPETEHHPTPSWGRRTAHIEMPLFTGHCNCLKQLRTGESCLTCKRCFTPENHKVVFQQH